MTSTANPTAKQQSQSASQLGYVNPTAQYENNPGDQLGYVNTTAQYENSPSSTTTSNPSSALSQYGNESSLLSNLGSSLSGLLGSNAGQLATYAGLYGLISSQAGATESENNALAGQISGIGQPAVNESQSLLGAYSGGQLTTPFQTQLTSALNANQNAATSEKAQSATLLGGASGGQNLQGALTGQYQQITNAQTQANTNAVSNAFTSELSASDSLLSAGGPYVQAGVAQEIQSNTQLQAQLSSLMSSLASAYGQSTAATSSASKPSSSSSKPQVGGSGGGGGGGGGGVGAPSGATGPYGHFAAGDYLPANYTMPGGDLTNDPENLGNTDPSSLAGSIDLPSIYNSSDYSGGFEEGSYGGYY